MKIFRVILVTALLTVSVQAQDLFTELQARVVKDGPLYTFRVLGDKDEGAFSAYGIHVIAPDGSEQMLDEFDALLPEGSEADALYVEDVNFDGYADLRIMQFLPGGANVPYFYWLYDPVTGLFRSSKAFEVVVSPEVDLEKGELLSRQRSSATEYVTEYYKPDGEIPVLKRREVRTFSPDGSSVLQVYEVKDDSGPELVETRQLGPEE